jgi:two-component system response regulator
VIAVSPSIAARLRKNNVTTRAKQESDLGLSKTLVAVQLSLAAATFIVSGSVNISELTGHLQGTRVFVDPLDWRHMMLMPALLTAGLLEVGSIAKRMLTFGHEMAEKAVIEKELMVGRDVQARMLPDKRFKGDYWKWRAIYHPAEALAGDWFDIREVEFKDGRKLLAVCLADVTGHGVGSSLSTSVICSHWSLWCAQLGQLEFPAEKSDREKVLCSAPIKIHDGLSALRKNENCTSMIALIDPYAREVTLTSAGHPGALIIGAKGLRYVTTAGERLGGELIGEAKWTPRTEALGDDDMLVIYSDGIVPVGATVLAWAGQLKKKMAAGSAGQPELLLMRTLHDNKRAFMKDPSNEDDMTLIMLRRG